MQARFAQCTLAAALALAFAWPAAADTKDARAGAQSPAAAQAAPAAREVRMSKLIGMNVVNPAGKKLGEVKDVVLDTNSGRVHYAVLSLGGLLGVGDKLFAMPLASVRPDGKGRLVLDATKESLASAPSFESSRWPDWNSGAFPRAADQRDATSAVASAEQREARFRRASDVLKAQVRDENAADIGNVADVVVDLSSGRVDYVVVRFDRAWNPNDKLVALPMSSLGAMATAPPPRRDGDAAAPPRNPPGVLSLESPSGPTKGTASAVDPPGSVDTRPPAVDPGRAAGVQRLERQPLGTTTSYADDEDLVFKGTREQLKDAPAFDTSRYPDLRDGARRNAPR